MRQSNIRICLAASGGGHVRQILDLEPVWSSFDHFFVTEDTALARTIAKDHRSHFVAHFALGQARPDSLMTMIGAAWRNFFQSARAIARERPDLLITTGAGAMFFSVLFARLRGAQVVVIESFARFDRPSLFFRLAAPLAHHTVVQSKALARFAPRAAVFDPFRMLDEPRPAKDEAVLATVGATLPFDRLVEMVAQLKAEGDIPEQLLIQTGVGGIRPAGVETVETLPFDEMNQALSKADILICHGGTGSLITGLKHGCRVIAVPRLRALGEHYDDHQAEITKALGSRGLISVANTLEELRQALRDQRGRTPPMATTDPQALIDHLRKLLAQLGARRTVAEPAAGTVAGEQAPMGDGRAVASAPSQTD